MSVGSWRKVDLSFRPRDLGLEACLSREWVLSNGLGGYSSSTLALMNTRKYHGLLVSSDNNLNRFMCLQKLDEEVTVGQNKAELSVNEFKDALKPSGLDYLDGFSFDLESVSLKYVVSGVEVLKTVRMARGRNAVIVSYAINNTQDSPVSMKVKVLTNSRGIHEMRRQDKSVSSSIVDRNTFLLKSYYGTMLVHSNFMECMEGASWFKDFKYRSEEERGEDSVEDSFSPGYFRIDVKPTSKYYCSVVAAVGADDIEAFRLLRDVLSASQAGSRVIQDSGVFTLLSSSDSFIVGAGASKTVIAGYPWFGEWGRDSMISLPGLALIRGRFEDAESVLDRFMNKIYAGRIPTNFEGGKPKYYDFDGTLWMIDRVKDYLDYVGIERGRHFLHTHWWSMKDVIKSYSQNVKDGILRHKSGTWMDTLRRDDAVEVQGLWYNALKTMEALSEMMGEGVDYHEFVDDFESNFMDKFWKGSFFSDTLSDGSLRPNQVIMLSMDYSMVPKENALEALKAVKEGLLTPYGLRTLSKSHQDYAGRYSGSPAEREKAYHNGSVWPWLLGPYVKACVKYGVSRDECVEALKPLLTTHLSEAGLGTISELFDGDEPHTPRGCVSQAWSVAEVLRAYYEDVGNRKLVF